DEALVGPALVAFEDQVEAQARPDVVQAADRAAHHLILQRLVAGGAEHGGEVDGPRRIAAGRHHHRKLVRPAHRAGDGLELVQRGLRPRAMSSRKPALTAFSTTPTSTKPTAVRPVAASTSTCSHGL